jgi:hypothetical protein
MVLFADVARMGWTFATALDTMAARGAGQEVLTLDATACVKNATDLLRALALRRIIVVGWTSGLATKRLRSSSIGSALLLMKRS